MVLPISDQVQLEYEAFGAATDPAIVLIGGFGAQMIGRRAPRPGAGGDPGRGARGTRYLGKTVLLIGIGVLLADAWLLVLAPLVAWTIQRTAIRHEEACLTRTFGTTYTDW